MTATERLREMLDERGVEWSYDTATDTVTWLNGPHWMHATELQHGMLDADMGLTPEQAIEVTFGRGECMSTSKYVNEFICSACGFGYDFISDPYQGPRYCPNCGRRVVDA